MSLIQNIMSDILAEWNIFEQFLLQPNSFPEFKNYLSTYRGLNQNNPNSSAKTNEIAKNSATSVLNFFRHKLQSHNVFQLEYNEASNLFNELEQNMNLTLYYWFGLNDKNFQWRTWIHFFDLEKFSINFQLSIGHNFSITLSEFGIYFGENNEFRYPKIAPISKLYNLKLEQNMQFLREKFAHARTLQREVCLFIDEWEYQNSILAVEYSQSIRQNKDLQLTINKMDLKRNHFATFGLESMCDFQYSINCYLNIIHDTDFIAECDALCALMLCAVQKLLLPASISRMVYSTQVIELFERFFEFRIQFCPEDYSAKLALQATQSALGKKFNPKLFELLEQKTFEWKLAFDPSSIIKAFSWAYSSEHHKTLCKLMGICYIKKTHNNTLDSYLLENLKSTFQIQEEFCAFLNKTIKLENSFFIDEILLTQLNKIFENLVKI